MTKYNPTMKRMWTLDELRELFDTLLNGYATLDTEQTFTKQGKEVACEMTKLTPTMASNIEAQRLNVYQIGKLVFVQGMIRATATISSHWQNIITGLPKSALADTYVCGVLLNQLNQRRDFYISNNNNQIQNVNPLAQDDRIYLCFMYYTNE